MRRIIRIISNKVWIIEMDPHKNRNETGTKHKKKKQILIPVILARLDGKMHVVLFAAPWCHFKSELSASFPYINIKQMLGMFYRTWCYRRGLLVLFSVQFKEPKSARSSETIWMLKQLTAFQIKNVSMKIIDYSLK